MPLKLADLGKTTREATFTYEGSTVHIKYRPSALTARVQMSSASLVTLGREFVGSDDDPDEIKRERLISAAESVLEALGDYTEVLSKMVADWDVLGEDGKPIPVTPSVIRDLPLDFVYEMFGAIMRANSPNAKSVEHHVAVS